MDRRLITLGLMSEINARGGLSLAAIQDLADEIAAETFGPHLARAASRLPVGMETIASDMNKARNAFLHWKRNRFLLPIYKGLDITTDAGFRTCMEDILLFLQTVPFVAPVGMGEPES
jgi:hypothetical protein